MNFGCKLWGLFKALIAGALNEIGNLTESKKSEILKKIDQTVKWLFYESATNGSIHNTARGTDMMENKTEKAIISTNMNS